MDVNMMPVDDFNPPDICGDERCRDYFIEFVYCFVIPGGIILLLTFMLTVIILCTCCKRYKTIYQYIYLLTLFLDNKAKCYL